jgi:hypothetical protein
MTVFLVVRALDVNYAQMAGVSAKIGFDGAAPSAVSQTARAGEFEREIPSGAASARVELTKAGFWDVTQELSFYFGLPPSMDWKNGQSLAARNYDVHSRGGSDFNLAVNLVLGHLKDAQADVDAVVARGGISYLKPQAHVIRDLDTPVLNPGGTGWNQLKHVKTGAVLPPGKVMFAQRKTVPELLMIYRPSGMARSFQIDGKNPQYVPIPFHIFFHPSPAGFQGVYPFSFKYLDLVARYCFYPQIHNVGKAMINQNHHSPDPCVFVYPVGSARQWFGVVATQTNLMRLCQEVSFFIQRMDGISYPLQPVGRCAVSAFSAAAQYLKMMMDNPDATFGDHLREIYAFDPYLLGQEATLCQQIATWWNGGADDRRFRMYTQWETWAKSMRRAIPSATVTNGPENARQDEASQASLVFTPFETFWSAIAAMIPPGGPLDIDLPPRSWGELHQLIPALFMQHARKNGKLFVP